MLCLTNALAAYCVALLFLELASIHLRQTFLYDVPIYALHPSICFSVILYRDLLSLRLMHYIKHTASI